ncbi:MAG TPA: FkbM family methyltransferase [Opitutaceae bacterium]|nr:FkbM family methyltransferase [Opitutaceae bacterium]
MPDTARSLVKRLLHATGWHVGRVNRHTAPFLAGEVHSLFDYQLFRTFDGNPRGLKFLQIGANDGTHGDPLRHFIARYEWSGVMVEPVPATFAALQRLHGKNPRVQLVQAAVDEKPGVRAIYTVADPERKLPEFVHAISSFHRDHLLSFSGLVPDIERHIVAQEVPCRTLREIVAAAKLDRIDVLQIDTEGHDDVVLAQVDFATLRPRLIQFEHNHLSSERLLACLLRLREAGYSFSMEARDVCAVRSSDR